MKDFDSAVVDAAGIETYYLEAGGGDAVVLVHGSGPGVSAYANWRLNIEPLARRLHVFAPDMAGFGSSQKLDAYGMDLWSRQLVGFLDALGLGEVSLVGNSFGGALALSVAIAHPERVKRLVLMGSMGLSFPITEGLDEVWGYEPSLENMRRLIELFAYDRSVITEELVRNRHEASLDPENRQAFSSMFPAPRQRWVEAMAFPEAQIATVEKETLIFHGRDDQVIPLENSYKLLRLIGPSQLHAFGRCGHWTQIEHSSEFNSIAGNFLTGAFEREVGR